MVILHGVNLAGITCWLALFLISLIVIWLSAVHITSECDEGGLMLLRLVCPVEPSVVVRSRN